MMATPGSTRTSGSTARPAGPLRAMLAVGLLVLGAGDLAAIHTVLLPSYLATRQVARAMAVVPTQVSVATVESPALDGGFPVVDGSMDVPTDEENAVPAQAEPVALAPVQPKAAEPVAVAAPEAPTWPNLLFERSTSWLSEDSRATLGKLADHLKEHSDVTARLEGHTDDLGEAEINLELSLTRAGRAKYWLVNQGVSPRQIEVHGFGASRPVMRERTAEARAQNRRVEITVRERTH